MLKTRTRSEKQKVANKRAQMDAMEEVLKVEQVTISWLDQMTRDVLEETRDAHVKADAHVSVCAKL
jgi:hypothetical protein